MNLKVGGRKRGSRIMGTVSWEIEENHEKISDVILYSHWDLNRSAGPNEPQKCYPWVKYHYMIQHSSDSGGMGCGLDDWKSSSGIRKRMQITCITLIFWHGVVLSVVQLVDALEMGTRIHKICEYKRNVFVIKASFVSLYPCLEMSWASWNVWVFGLLFGKKKK